MHPKWIIGLVTLWVVLTLFNGIVEDQYLGPGEVGILDSLMEPDIPSFSNPIEAIGGVFSMSLDWLGSLWDTFWFNHAHLAQDGWELVKWGIFRPISIGVVVSLVLAAVRGVSAS